MRKNAFLNRVRSLYNIDGDLLPELSQEQQAMFLANPVQFFLAATATQSDAIMREIEKRQHKGDARAAARSKQRSSAMAGQRELLLPIAGGKPAAPGEDEQQTKKRKAS